MAEEKEVRKGDHGLTDRVAALFWKYKEAILYLVFGGLTTLVNIVSYAVCARAFHMGTLLSNGIAWVLGVAFAYGTNKRFVFESKTDGAAETLKELFSFVACRLGTGVLDMAVMYVAVDLLGWYDVGMKILSNIVVIILNFVLSKLLIFRKKEC